MELLERQGKQPFSVVIFLLFLFPVLNKSFPPLNLRFQDCKMCLTWDSKDYSCAQFGSSYTKIKAVQRRLAGPYINMTDYVVLHISKKELLERWLRFKSACCREPGFANSGWQRDDNDPQVQLQGIQASVSLSTGISIYMHISTHTCTHTHTF